MTLILVNQTDPLSVLLITQGHDGGARVQPMRLWHAVRVAVREGRDTAVVFKEDYVVDVQLVTEDLGDLSWADAAKPGGTPPMASVAPAPGASELVYDGLLRLILTEAVQAGPGIQRDARCNDRGDIDIEVLAGVDVDAVIDGVSLA